METTVINHPADKEKLERKQNNKKLKMERNRIAFERLQLAWIRACLTLMVIGIGIYEYYLNRVETGKPTLLNIRYVTGRELSLFMIFTSFTILVLATYRHTRNMQFMKQQYPEMPPSPSSLLSYLILALTFFLGSIVLFK